MRTTECRGVEQQLEYRIKEWFRDAQGFRLEDFDRCQPPQGPPPQWVDDSGALKVGEGILIPEGFSRLFPIEREGFDSSLQRIVRNGGTLVPYQPSNNLNEILFELLNTAPTPKGALDFVNRFGPMTKAGWFHENWGESVTTTIDHIRRMNSLISAWPTHGDNTAIGQILGADGFSFIGKPEIRIIYDQPKKTPLIQVTFENLGTLLWAHLFELLTSKDAVLRRCAQCNGLFLAGVGTERRLDAKFCCDAHRALFHHMRRPRKALPPATDKAPARPRGRPRRNPA
jgi:hypothetical protein